MKQNLTLLGPGSPRLMFNQAGLNYAFKGLLDDVALYDAVLNNEGVWQVYQRGAASLKQRIPDDPYKTGAHPG